MSKTAEQRMSSGTHIVVNDYSNLLVISLNQWLRLANILEYMLYFSMEGRAYLSCVCIIYIKIDGNFLHSEVHTSMDVAPRRIWKGWQGEDPLADCCYACTNLQ